MSLKQGPSPSLWQLWGGCASALGIFGSEASGEGRAPSAPAAGILLPAFVPAQLCPGTALLTPGNGLGGSKPGVKEQTPGFGIARELQHHHWCPWDELGGRG